jgi:hypothetical protein
MNKRAFLIVQFFLTSRQPWTDLANINTQFLQYTESIEKQSNLAIQWLSHIEVELELDREIDGGVHTTITCLPDIATAKSPLEALTVLYSQILKKRKENLQDTPNNSTCIIHSFNLFNPNETWLDLKGVRL